MCIRDRFWTDVIWGDLDFLFIDMPPGTGDVPLTVFQSIPVDGIVIVTSPQELVSMIVSKAVKMAEMMKIPVLGLVENMSYFRCPDNGKDYKIFGESHIDEIAGKHGLQVLAKLPIDPKISAACDAGTVSYTHLDVYKRQIKILNGKQLEYPVYMDNEAQPASAKAGITEASIAFCETMEDAGYFVGIYGSAVSGFQERMDDSKLKAYSHWVAQYASKCTYSGEYGIWQYSSTGRVDGIKGNVDMDYGYIDYPSIIKNGGFNGYEKTTADKNKSGEDKPTSKKSVDELAAEVIHGKWGNGEERKKKLTSAGYDYSVVQARVNEILSGKSTSTPVTYETYTVVKGDTLWGIAAKKLGSGARYKEIKTLNGLSSDTIYACLLCTSRCV